MCSQLIWELLLPLGQYIVKGIASPDIGNPILRKYHAENIMRTSYSADILLDLLRPLCYD